MNSYLRNLATMVIESGQTIRPRLPGHFEPPSLAFASFADSKVSSGGIDVTSAIHQGQPGMPKPAVLPLSPEIRSEKSEPLYTARVLSPADGQEAPAELSKRPEMAESIVQPITVRTEQRHGATGQEMPVGLAPVARSSSRKTRSEKSGPPYTARVPSPADGQEAPAGSSQRSERTESIIQPVTLKQGERQDIASQEISLVQAADPSAPATFIEGKRLYPFSNRRPLLPTSAHMKSLSTMPADSQGIQPTSLLPSDLRRLEAQEFRLFPTDDTLPVAAALADRHKENKPPPLQVEAKSIPLPTAQGLLKEPSVQQVLKIPGQHTLKATGDTPTSGVHREPSVQITIGRVEVRAVMPPVPPIRAPSVRRQPGVSLDQYLQKRNERKG